MARVCLRSLGAKGGLRGPLTGAQTSLMNSCAIHICQALMSLCMFLDVGVWGTAPEGVRDCHHRRCVVSQWRTRLSVSPTMVAFDGLIHPMFHLICMGQGSDSDIDSQRPNRVFLPTRGWRGTHHLQPAIPTRACMVEGLCVVWVSPPLAMVRTPFQTLKIWPDTTMAPNSIPHLTSHVWGLGLGPLACWAFACGAHPNDPLCLFSLRARPGVAGSGCQWRAGGR